MSAPWQRFRRFCLAPCCLLSSSIRPPRRRRSLPQAGRGRGRRCSRSFACESRPHRPAARLRRAARLAAAGRTTLEARGRRLPAPPCRSAAAARSRSTWWASPTRAWGTFSFVAGTRQTAAAQGVSQNGPSTRICSLIWDQGGVGALLATEDKRPHSSRGTQEPGGVSGISAPRRINGRAHGGGGTVGGGGRGDRWIYSGDGSPLTTMRFPRSRTRWVLIFALCMSRLLAQGPGRDVDASRLAGCSPPLRLCFRLLVCG